MEDKKNNSFSFARPARVPVSVWSFSSAMSSVSERICFARASSVFFKEMGKREREREKDHQRSKREGARNTNDAIRAQGKKAIKIVSLFFFGSHFFFLRSLFFWEKEGLAKGKERVGGSLTRKK